jgi:hypothetical protein
MSLVVADRSCVAGGVETICLSLLPELVRLNLDVVWALDGLLAARRPGFWTAPLQPITRKAPTP